MLAERFHMREERVRIPHLVVVPGEDFHEPPQNSRQREVGYGGIGTSNDVGGDDRLSGHRKYSSPALFFRRRLEHKIDFFRRGVALRDEGKIEDRSERDGHAQGNPIEAARKLRIGLGHRVRGARAGGNDVPCRGASLAEILFRGRVDEALGRRIRMDRVEERRFNA